MGGTGSSSAEARYNSRVVGDCLKSAGRDVDEGW